jgi:hypothetical protein
MKKLFIIGSLIILFTISLNLIHFPALALLREHHQTPGVLRYHAQHSIKDRQQRAWQVVLFPEDISSNTKYYLRLVGFPGLVAFIHPQSLEIITSEGNILIAPDVFARTTPASNVGQYELTKILPKLPTKGSVKLIFSLLKEDGTVQDTTLSISPAMITEWRWLNSKYF